MRPSGRANAELRPIKFTRHYTRYAEGSVLVEFGHTKVLCNATLEEKVPRFLKDQHQGWITAEYGMLPRSTHDRMQREAIHGRQSGRTQEIQRLIGRALRTAVDLKALGERTVIVDCEVLQADGGTRTAAITGGYVALIDALQGVVAKNTSIQSLIRSAVAAVSVGIYQGEVILDLEYAEDSHAETDMNVVMNAAGAYVEVQGTAEAHPFQATELQQMLDLAKQGITALLVAQQEALAG